MARHFLPSDSEGGDPDSRARILRHSRPYTVQGALDTKTLVTYTMLAAGGL